MYTDQILFIHYTHTLNMYIFYIYRYIHAQITVTNDKGVVQYNINKKKISNILMKRKLNIQIAINRDP